MSVFTLICTILHCNSRSAPVKVTRNEFGESINTKGLYPIGEGAGYAGGIISAAIDGFKVVDLAFATL